MQRQEAKACVSLNLFVYGQPQRDLLVTVGEVYPLS